MPASTLDLATGLVSFVLTLMILSYLVGDNPAFRVAVYIFVGASAGYAAVVAGRQVIWPRLIQPLLSGNLLAIFPLLLGVLLLMKLSTRTARLGNISMGFLVGVGAAVAVGGAVMGTLFPQTQATFNLPSLTNLLADINTLVSNSNQPTPYLEQFASGIFIIIGTISTLVYFHFGAKATPGGPQRSKLVTSLGWVGQVFIAITFGVLFAGAFTAAMTALIERLSFLLNFIGTLFTAL
jgi:hypothetical protein